MTSETAAAWNKTDLYLTHFVLVNYTTALSVCLSLTPILNIFFLLFLVFAVVVFVACSEHCLFPLCYATDAVRFLLCCSV